IGAAVWPPRSGVGIGAKYWQQSKAHPLPHRLIAVEKIAEPLFRQSWVRHGAPPPSRLHQHPPLSPRPPSPANLPPLDRRWLLSLSTKLLPAPESVVPAAALRAAAGRVDELVHQ